MSEFIKLWLFYLLLSGFIRNAFKKDVYNALMGGNDYNFIFGDFKVLRKE